MIVDAHVHFWDPRELRYPWLAGIPALERPCLPAEYAGGAAAAEVGKVIVVECNCLPEQCLLETAYFERLAERGAPIAGVVAFVEMADAPRRRAVLDALARSPLVKGARQNIQGEAAGFCTRPAFVAGVREVGERGLVFDLCATHDQLVDVVKLVQCCPDTRFVLDHCGKPAIREGRLASWRVDIARLAAFPNLWCKLSGLLTEAAPDWSEEELLPCAAHVVECFGRERVMFGSDWPVLTTVGSFQDWHDFTRRATADWGASDARRFYGDTAAHVYAL